MGPSFSNLNWICRLNLKKPFKYTLDINMTLITSKMYKLLFINDSNTSIKKKAAENYSKKYQQQKLLSIAVIVNIWTTYREFRVLICMGHGGSAGLPTISIYEIKICLKHFSPG